MKKIPRLFSKKREKHISKESIWVYEKNILECAYIKIDGVPCLSIEGVLYKRFNRKLLRNKKRKPEPSHWIPSEAEPSEFEKNWYGWTIITQKSCDKYYIKGLHNYIKSHNHKLSSGIYELIGPKINNNPYKIEDYYLIPHCSHKVYIFVSYHSILNYFLTDSIGSVSEGLVFYGIGNRRAKVRRKDLGLEWPIVTKTIRKNKSIKSKDGD